MSEEEETPSRTPMLLLAGLMGVSVIVAGRILLRGSAKPVPLKPAPVQRAARAWPEEEAPRVQDPTMLTQSEKSSLDMVTRPVEAAKMGEADARLAPPGGAKDVTAPSAAPPPKKDTGPDPLSDAEKSQLSQLAGRDLTDPAKAAAVAGSNSLWSALMRALSHHPRFVSYLVNNETVINAYMSRPLSQKTCQSGAASKSYLTDTKKPNGVTNAMNVLDTLLHGDKEMPTVLFSSKLADAILRCPSVDALTHDRGAIAEIAMGNPRTLQFVNDPAIMQGLAANPAAMTSFQTIQSNLGH